MVVLKVTTDEAKVLKQVLADLIWGPDTSSQPVKVTVDVLKHIHAKVLKVT